MNIFVDIDNTICFTNGEDYENATPIMDRIECINSFYQLGCHITYWTARGSGTGIDWSRITKKQLRGWGAKYHELKFGKPCYDLFIDDKNVHAEAFFKQCDLNGTLTNRTNNAD